MVWKKARIYTPRTPKYSKTITAWCERNSDLVDEYVCDSDGHWVYLKDGLIHESTECGTIREDTVTEMMERLSRSEIRKGKATPLCHPEE